MPRSVDFGPFSLDLRRRQLLRTKDATVLHLSPKAYELLLVLVENRPRAIGKGELHERLWPKTFVSEATLSSLIAELREALGESAREALFVRTVHGFGYAFAGEARDVGAVEALPIRQWIICNGREKALGEGEHLIGRDADVAIPLVSPTVSRHHAKIVVSADEATVEDLGSKNGTFVRGQAITSPTALVDGDRIRVGAYEITFRTVSSSSSTETQL